MHHHTALLALYDNARAVCHQSCPQKHLLVVCASNCSLLGSLLDDVLKSEVGTELYNKIERIRSLAQCAAQLATKHDSVRQLAWAPPARSDTAAVQPAGNQDTAGGSTDCSPIPPLYDRTCRFTSDLVSNMPLAKHYPDTRTLTTGSPQPHKHTCCPRLPTQLTAGLLVAVAAIPRAAAACCAPVCVCAGCIPHAVTAHG